MFNRYALRPSRPTLEHRRRAILRALGALASCCEETTVPELRRYAARLSALIDDSEEILAPYDAPWGLIRAEGIFMHETKSLPITNLERINRTAKRAALIVEGRLAA